MHIISAERASDLLSEGHPLIDFYIEGELKIEGNQIWYEEVVFENCIVEFFSGNGTHFDRPLRLTNSRFRECQFVFTYFLGGLTIDNCTFDSYLDFQAGGHNKPGNTVAIINNEFAGFVNFFDCWYSNRVTISNNKFHKGTNIPPCSRLRRD